jgi:large subunit ribosomal protein L19e
MTNLTKKKQLAAKTLKVGKNRIHFNSENITEIKEAITKQDIKELHADGIISIKPVKGRKKVERRNRKRGPGKIKKKVNKRKQVYVKITRKLRNYLSELKKLKVIDNDLYLDLRKKIRMRVFRSKSHLKEYLETQEDIKINPHKLIRKIQKENKGKNKTVKKKVSKKTVKKTKEKSKDNKK